jgi:sulfite exporter TauE/SafE
MEVIIAAISLGLLGSFHCIGMCGPIALSLPVHQYPKLKKYFGILIYNLGRILTYTCLGIVFGLLGQSFYLGGFQKILSIILGLLLLVSVILNNIRSFNSKQFNFMYSFINTIKIQLGIL